MNHVQVATDHYNSSYDTHTRYYSYIEQLICVRDGKPGSVLEIVVGNGFVARELRSMGIHVETLDIDPELQPDHVGSVHQLPFPDNYFDTITCCEVLEHLPFDQFTVCMREIARVTRRHAVISMPNSASVLHVEISRGWAVPRHKRWLFSGSPLRKPQPHVFDGQHYWEIGKQGYPVKRVIAAMTDAGFDVVNNYRLHLNPYHHFFILKKKIL